MNRGLLLTMTEPPPRLEEEFNAWYDDEHMAERLAVPGFRSARRWVADAKPGEGKYLATYELDSPGVLTSAVYLARLNNPTPWSAQPEELRGFPPLGLRADVSRTGRSGRTRPGADVLRWRGTVWEGHPGRAASAPIPRPERQTGPRRPLRAGSASAAAAGKRLGVPPLPRLP